MSFLHPVDALKNRARRKPNSPAYYFLKLGDQSFKEFQKLSWLELLKKVSAYSEFLKEKGIQPGQAIAILAANGVEWIALDLAALALGIVTVPLYLQSHRSEIEFILFESESVALFSDKPLEQLKISQWTFAEVENATKSFQGDPFALEMNSRPPESLATLIYTSGTSGKPKGVMHSLQSPQKVAEALEIVGKMSEKDRLISYLPLSHVAERVFIEFCSIYLGCQVYFLDRVEKLPQALPKVRPTVFFAVPRIWEMFKNRIERELNGNAQLQARLQAIPSLLRKFLVSIMIKRKMGLNKSRFNISGAAKISIETAEYLYGLGIKISEAFGMTECCGAATVNYLNDIRLGTVGKAFPGVDVKIDSSGEILLKTPYQFQGYWKNPEESRAVVQNGWLKTGDVGFLDAEGRLTITDRLKNIFKLSSGKYVAPAPIEAALRSDPGIIEVLVLGEGQDHCVALASVNETVNETSLTRLMDRVNAQHPMHEQVKSIGCVTEIWSSQSGDLTASLKPKRKLIIEKYDGFIRELYESRSKVKFFKERESRAYSSV